MREPEQIYDDYRTTIASLERELSARSRLTQQMEQIEIRLRAELKECSSKLEAALDRAEKAERSEAAMLNHVQAIEKERHSDDGKRWNMYRNASQNEVFICFGDHERGTGCTHVRFVEGSRLDSALARLEWSTQQLDIEQAATKAATDRLEAGANAWAGSGAFNNHECYFGARIGKCPKSNECWECRLHLALYPLPPPRRRDPRTS